MNKEALIQNPENPRRHVVLLGAGAAFDWHTAPQPQYIIYLEGEVEVETSGGEKRTFKPGDILFATDLKGQGHITRTLSKGKSLVITTEKLAELKQEDTLPLRCKL
jgi:uncharacterized cupin superfamily protein